jgi:hypothetical protein
MSYRSDNLQPWEIATVVSVTGLALVAVGLRMLSRYERKQSLWWDDWMIIFSMVRVHCLCRENEIANSPSRQQAWNLMVVGFIFAMIGEGMGHHADTIPMENVITIAKLLVAAEILYVFNLAWTKISFLLMYYRIFHVPYFKRWAYIIGTFVVIWVITIMFVFIFICVPVEKLWYPQLPGHCVNQVGTWIANAASTIGTDLAILVLPIPQVWKLQLATSQKIALTFAFSLGFLYVHLCSPDGITGSDQTASSSLPATALPFSSRTVRWTLPTPWPQRSAGPPLKFLRASSPHASPPCDQRCNSARAIWVSRVFYRA